MFQLRRSCTFVKILVMVSLTAFMAKVLYQYAWASSKRDIYASLTTAIEASTTYLNDHLISKPAEDPGPEYPGPEYPEPEDPGPPGRMKDFISRSRNRQRNSTQETNVKQTLRKIIQTGSTYPILSKYYDAYKNANNELKKLVDDEAIRKSKLNCELMFKNNSREFTRARELKHPKYSDEIYINATADCDVYRKLRGYYTNLNVSDDERLFPLAFGIVAHKDPGAFERLIRLIYRPHNFYCVHVDLKSPESVFQAFAGIVNCLPNVFLVTKREIVVYQGFTMLQAHLNCFFDLLKYDWEYLLNYAGTELPLRPNNQLVKILRTQNRTNNISQDKKLTQHQQNRWLRKYITKVNEKKGRGKIDRVEQTNNPAPYGIKKVTKNSVFGAFTREFVSYLANDKRAQGLIEWSTFSPDEHVFGTLFNGIDNPQLQAPRADTGVLPNRDYFVRWVVWGNDRPCHGRRERGICVFAARDLPSLSTVPHLAANKFSLEYSAPTVDCIEWLVESRSRNISDVDLDYYRKLQSRKKMPSRPDRLTAFSKRKC